MKGYEGLYRVSNWGRVWSCPREETFTYNRTCGPVQITRVRKGKFMSPRKGVYLMLNLCKDRVYKAFLLHRLVALHFVPNPDNKPEVNHIDEDKHNPRADNLEWMTSSENSLHSCYKTTGSKVGNSKLKEDEVLEVVKLLEDGFPQTEIGEFFGVSNHTIHKIKTGANWSWLTGIGKGV